MAWAQLDCTKGQIDAAGRVLAEGSDDYAIIEDALAVLDNWRSAHSFPLNTMQMGLRQRARRVYEHALVAQRLKRVPSIIYKLRRFPAMRLSRMQDIGGCRAVLQTTAQVARLRDDFRKSRSNHELVNEKNYISTPKDSGYRGIHLIYRYQSERNPEYKGKLIEVQLRSRLQHAWATAVETVGTFLQQSLKASQGSKQWLRFFALASSAFAIDERQVPVPATPDDRNELLDEIDSIAKALDVRRRLGAYGAALRVAASPARKNAHFFLLSLSASDGSLTVRRFRKDELTTATNAYLEEEKAVADARGAEVVLVAVDSLDALRRAYPNYFLDTQIFFRELDRVTERVRRAARVKA